MESLDQQEQRLSAWNHLDHSRRQGIFQVAVEKDMRVYGSGGSKEALLNSAGTVSISK